jgi:pyruvate kinase
VGVKLEVIVTAPPYADFLAEVAEHPVVSGLRLNTVMPLRGGPAEGLVRLRKFEQPLWVDLKGRQLRVVEAAIPPYTEVLLSHAIEVETPVEAYFSDGRERVRVAAVDGRRLILAEGPRRLIGPGESVNIVDPSLKILGTLTETDRAYLAAMKTGGQNKVMLSYVETLEDIQEVQELLPDAEVLIKIETQKGLDFAKAHKSTLGNLVAARGDLFVEVSRPHHILNAMQTIITADPQAIAASRIFDSLAQHPVPNSADISDIGFLLTLGYRTFMLGDAVCFQRETVIEALNLLQAIGHDFDQN